MRKPKIRELIEAVKSLLSWPYTTKFPRVATPVPEGFRGRPRYNQDECVGCGACAEVCPARAIDIEDVVTEKGRGLRRLTHHYDMCVYCGLCQTACITDKGITLSDEYDMASYERSGMTDISEKELLFCEVCGSPIACVDHIRWIAKKIGPLAYANPSLYLTRHKKDLKALIDGAPGKKAPVGRTDQLRITCPSCRREVLFSEQWW